jgi:hypothetical protein
MRQQEHKHTSIQTVKNPIKRYRVLQTLQAKSQIALLFFMFIIGVEAQSSLSKTMNRPIVKKGNNGEVLKASYGDRLAIHVIGRNDSKKSPKKYATILANAFANRKYTDNPIYITVTYEKRNKAGHTLAIIYMDGSRYKTKQGYNVFTPEQIGKAIRLITKRYVEIYGSRYVIKKGVKPNLIANIN